jgi:hypothetical protein
VKRETALTRSDDAEAPGPCHSVALLAPMGPHLTALRIYFDLPDDQLALLARLLPRLVELSVFL